MSARQAPNIRKPLVYARQAPSHVPNIILWVSLPQASWLRISFDFKQPDIVLILRIGRLMIMTADAYHILT